ncbi:MAG: methionine--tRNA ligase [Coriobacteriia bacterium]|nr:methionine--tRNA ligase [Coriobacteriia bacterium]
MSNQQSFYLTTPIYYVNSVPHLGTAYTTIAADTLARYRRMCGDDVWFLTGLDEHGQKVEQAAVENGVTPIEWADRMAAKFHEAWEMLNISNDDFIRTTEPRHENGVQALLNTLHERGDIYAGTYEGWYCVPCETYFTEDQLHEDHTCPQCSRKVEFVREDNYFFKLSSYADRLLALYEENPHFIQPETRRNEVLSFVKGGLRDLSISRANVKWGIPLPWDESHTIYVWFDALINYITAIGYGSDDPAKQAEFAKRWPAQFHFVGKDIIRFHCVIWPAMLIAAGLPVPEKVFAHGFLLTKGEKMSKSKGNAMAPADLVAKFGVDAYRFYFLREVQFGLDGSISLEAMIQRYNGDLANDWGNLCSRLFNMVGKYCDGVVPATSGEATADDAELAAIAAGLPAEFEARMAVLDYAGAIEATWEIIKRTNRYIEDSAPWNLAKSEETLPRLHTVLYNALEAVRIAALFTAPVMPATSAEVWSRMGLSDPIAVTDITAEAAWGRLPVGNTVVKGDALFQRIVEDAE